MVDLPSVPFPAATCAWLACWMLAWVLVSPVFAADESGRTGREAELILIAAQRGEVDTVRARQAPRARSFADAGRWDAIRRALLEGERKEAFQTCARFRSFHGR